MHICEKVTMHDDKTFGVYVSELADVIVFFLVLQVLDLLHK